MGSLRSFGIAAGALGIALGAVSIYGLTHRHRAEAPPPPASGAPSQPSYNYRPVPGYRAGLPLRPMDVEIFEAIERGHIGPKAKEDLFPGKPYRVRLLSTHGDDSINIVTIDLDRDGTWDERWLLKGDGVERMTLGKESIPFELRHGRWLPY